MTFIDLCNSAAEAKFSKRTHQDKGRRILLEQRTDSASFSTIEGEPPKFTKAGRYFETAAEVWVIVATDEQA